MKTKIALITGGTAGIGYACAKRFAENNITPIITGRRQQLGKECEASLKKIDKNSRYIACDMQNHERLKQLVQTIIDEYGQIDFLINNAGIAGPADNNDFINYPFDTWQQVFDINVHSTFLLTQEVLKHMLKQSSGRIINLSSVAGLKAGTISACYTASKHALLGMTKSIAKQYAKLNIQINAVCPGMIETPMIDDHKDAAKNIPSQRFGKAEEVAELITFLCLSKGSFINGSAITIDGGITA